MKLFISRLHYKKDLTDFEKYVMFFLRFLGFFYNLAVKLRNKLYDKKILKTYSSKSFVISVGNLTAGGSGKTPVVLEIAKYYLGKNKKTAVLSRGYGAKLKNRKPYLVSNGSGAMLSAYLAGDEPVWIADNAKGVYAAACSSRIKAEKLVQEMFRPDVIILDDGFQHRKMKRDIDIVLIDAKNKFGNGYMLPAGPLREEISNIRRADKIVVVNKSLDSRNALRYCDYLKKKYKKDTYMCKIVPDYTYNILTKEELPKKTKIMAFSAIGQNKSFYNFLKKDYKLSAVMEFEDHHSYDKEDISKIIQYAQEENISSVVTTEKDAVKLISIIKDLEMPVKFYALKLKAYIDVKDICGK